VRLRRIDTNRHRLADHVLDFGGDLASSHRLTVDAIAQGGEPFGTAIVNVTVLAPHTRDCGIKWACVFGKVQLIAPGRWRARQHADTENGSEATDGPDDQQDHSSERLIGGLLRHERTLTTALRCSMSRLQDVGAADHWRCWICDLPVDPSLSVNDDRGPSVDSLTTKSKGKGRGFFAGQERLAHRSCNTRKGAVTAVVAWPEHLFVVDPGVIITSVDRLERKGGREVMARCPTRSDGDEAAAWLLDRLSRLRPGLAFTTTVEPGGGQFMLVLTAPR
jgi:hypothetical protein